MAQTTEAQPKPDDLVNEDPRMALMLAYSDMEYAVSLARERLPDESKPVEPADIIGELTKGGLVRPEVLQVFNGLRELRNAAAHGQLVATREEAARYLGFAADVKRALQLKA